MRLLRAISAAWRELVTSPESEGYIELDPTPTPQEESRGFRNSKYMLGPLEQLNFQDKAQDIRLKRRFAHFAYGIATAWMIFLVIMTFMQGLRDGYTFDFDYFVVRVPPFYLEQWAFVAAFTSSTGSIFGLARIIGQYLYSNGATSKRLKEDNHDVESGH